MTQPSVYRSFLLTVLQHVTTEHLQKAVSALADASLIMKRLYAVGLGLLLTLGGASPGWAVCLVSVTGASTGDLFAAVVGADGNLYYSFFDTNGDCTDNPFDTDGDGTDCATEGATDAHSNVLPFAPANTGENSANLDRDTPNTGNRWAGFASFGLSSWLPVPGNPGLAQNTDIDCVLIQDGAETEIMIVSLGTFLAVTECVFDLDGNGTFIQTRNNTATGGAGDLDGDGWLGLSTASPCLTID